MFQTYLFEKNVYSNISVEKYQIFSHNDNT